MSRSERLRVTAIAAAALIAALLLWGARPAEATFPGSNGLIVFDSNRSIAASDPSATDSEIFTTNAGGSGLTQLTSNDTNDGHAAWSPDGQKIAFASRRDGDYEIYVIDAEPESATNEPVKLTSNATARDVNPTWSPNGTRIAFESDRDGNGDVYKMGADGNNEVRLTTNPAFDGDPVFSPDGRKIAFDSDRAATTTSTSCRRAGPTPSASPGTPRKTSSLPGPRTGTS